MLKAYIFLEESTVWQWKNNCGDRAGKAGMSLYQDFTASFTFLKMVFFLLEAAGEHEKLKKSKYSQGKKRKSVKKNKNQTHFYKITSGSSSK